MPNHETNTVVIIGEPQNLQKFLDEAFTEGKLDFQKIVPMPEELQKLTAELEVFPTQEEVDAHQKKMEERNAKLPEFFRKDYEGMTYAITTTQHADLTARFGAALDWYSWNIAHWGTKWNAYDQGPVKLGTYKNSEGTYGRLDFTFLTAWSQPAPVFEAIEETWDVKVHAVTVDEGGFPDVEYGDPYGESYLSRRVVIEPEYYDNKV